MQPLFTAGCRESTWSRQSRGARGAPRAARGDTTLPSLTPFTWGGHRAIFGTRAGSGEACVGLRAARRRGSDHARVWASE
jgi:hypothetical protein